MWFLLPRLIFFTFYTACCTTFSRESDHDSAHPEPKSRRYLAAVVEMVTPIFFPFISAGSLSEEAAGHKQLVACSEIRI